MKKFFPFSVACILCILVGLFAGFVFGRLTAQKPAADTGLTFRLEQTNGMFRLAEIRNATPGIATNVSITINSQADK
jgi:hypothetical protein